MNEEKRRFSPPVVGGSSLLVIFAVLCLTVFALLSLSTVRADRHLGDAAAASVAGYYAADVEAETILAQLRRGEVPNDVPITTAISDPGGTVISYACPISDTQELRVEIAFHGGLGDDYEILRWQAVSTADWVPDDSLTVWDGELF